MRKNTRRNDHRERSAQTGTAVARGPVELRDEQLAGLGGGSEVLNEMNQILDECGGDVECVAGLLHI